MSALDRRRTSRVGVVLLVLGLLALPSGAVAQPTTDLHQLEWFVHVDLIDAAAGRNLAFWQNVVNQSMAEANLLLEGNQGPVDLPCCTRIEASVSLATFGTPGDGLDVLDAASDYTALAGIGLPGSQAFLVDSITYCGGPAPTTIGCAQLPACTGDPNDDPNLFMTVTVDALNSATLGKVVAHERGHNACLTHINTDECQLMRSGGGGGCLDATECTNFAAARNASGGTCSCHDGLGGILSDNTPCSGVAGGICSGGACGSPSGDAGVTLFCAAGPESANGEATDEALRMSGLTGNWQTLGLFAPTGDEVKGLAYATDSETLFGVVPTSGDDRVVSVDRISGDLQTLGTIANGSRELVALAYDPGATSAASDDRLLALETDGNFEQVHAIDPASPNSSTNLGSLPFGAPNGFRGLAYDSAGGRLFTASPFVDGIYEIGLSTCPAACGLTQQVGAGVPRSDASLAYSPVTGKLYLTGTQSPAAPLGRRHMYNVLDPGDFSNSGESRVLDSATPAGLAALPVPPACSDGADNDGDGFVDFPNDPGCQNASSTIENPQCQDGINNDNQIGTDFDGGVSVLGAGNGDPNGADPQCNNAFRNKEAGGPRCGLGPGLALLLPIVAALRRRRASA